MKNDGASASLARPLKFLHAGFWGSIASFALAMGASRMLDPGGASALSSSVLLTAFVVLGCCYWAALAVLAHRLKSRWLVWVAVGLATLAIGFVATYLLMVSRTRRELAQRRSAHA